MTTLTALCFALEDLKAEIPTAYLLEDGTPSLVSHFSWSSAKTMENLLAPCCHLLRHSENMAKSANALLFVFSRLIFKTKHPKHIDTDTLQKADGKISLLTRSTHEHG